MPETTALDTRQLAMRDRLVTRRAAKHWRQDGRSHLVEYTIYCQAKDRCNNPRNPSYKDYGARGIKFRFRTFAQFFAEVGPRPEGTEPSGRAAYSIHRIDNDGHYEVGNVKWATRAEQRSNKRNPSAAKQYTSGAQGIMFSTDHKKFRAYLRTEGKRVHVGYFATAELAHLAANAAAEYHFGPSAATDTVAAAA